MIKKNIIFFVLLVVFFAASWSLFRTDFFLVHDFTHGARIVEMQKALADGHFPVRWSSDFGFGYGMPLFEFYAPLPYYVGAILYSFGFSLINSIKLLFLISTFVTLFGGYKLGKTLFGSAGGLLVSAALTLAPYRAVNLFIRGAISEAWGIMVLPLILYGIVKVIKKEKSGWIVLLISLLILFLSHNLTSLIFIPLSIVFGAVYLFLSTPKGKKRCNFFLERFLILFGTYLLAIAISSFYLLPAILEKDFTHLETLISGGFNYKLHFLSLRQFFQVNWKFGGSNYGPQDDISFYLGTGQLIGMAISGYLFVKYFLKTIQTKSKINKKTLLYLTTLLLLGFSIFMSSYRSMFVWEKLEFLSFIQFPWRYLSALIVFLSLAIGFLTSFIEHKLLRILFSAIILLVIISSNWSFFQPEKYLADSSDYYYRDANKIRFEMSKTLPDYIPIQMAETEIKPVALNGEILFCEINQRLQIQNCPFEFNKLVDKTHQKLVAVNAPNNIVIDFAVADFPGWVAEVDGEVVDHQTSSFGTILVPVSAGNHQVAIEFKNSQLRSRADKISLAGLIVFLSIFFWYDGGLKNILKRIK